MLEKDWITESGLRAAVCVNNVMGHRMGYVAVPKEHPAFGVDYSNELLSDIEVHGGLTYDGGQGYPLDEPDVWWFGYDCAHFGDMVPGLTRLTGRMLCGSNEPRSLAYCENECENLARQLVELAAKSSQGERNELA